MLVDGAFHNDSSLHPLVRRTMIPSIIFRFVECPVVADAVQVVAVMQFVNLIAGMCRAHHGAPTADVTFVSFQVGPDCPVRVSRFYKEVEIRGAFQLEHLQMTGENNESLLFTFLSLFGFSVFLGFIGSNLTYFSITIIFR